LGTDTEPIGSPAGKHSVIPQEDVERRCRKEDVEFVEGRQGLAPDQWRMLLELTDQWAVILQVEAAVAHFGLVFFLLFSNA